MIKTSIQCNKFGHFLPTTEVEVLSLVRRAISQGQKIRVLGSLHSIQPAITGFNQRNTMLISLDFLNRIAIADRETKTVRVQAGCRLDFDPYSLSGNSTHGNGLVGFLDAIGWALPDLGGITHQSIAGFLATGSAGGTLQHSIYDHISGVRLIDGMARVHEIDRSHPLFHGAVVSLGLWGIITEVSFRCVERYDIIGKESVVRIKEAPFAVEKSRNDRRQGLENFLREKEYSRLMWWPQERVQKLVIWEASRMSVRDSELLQHFTPGKLKKKPYRQMGKFPNLANRVAGLYLTVSGNALFKEPKHFLNKYREELLRMLNLFIVSDDEKPGRANSIPQYFNDSWSHGLPMDYEMDDEIFPTEFTELWIPARFADEAMTALSKHYRSKGSAATGSYCCEIYAAKKSDQWLSPSYATDVVRFDFFWYSKIKADPNQVFFPQFWQLLQKFNFRLHWAKHMPPQTTVWRNYLKRQYPKWNDFVKKRRSLDPQNVFLTDYWSHYFS